MTVQQYSSTAPSSPVPLQRPSSWHSPVPYLFGGLAAMLGLIAFALLILACSYWKLSGDMDNSSGSNGDQRDLEAATTGDLKPDIKELNPVFEDKYLVIMAGEAKPTFLATPVSSRASLFGSCSSRDTSSTSTDEKSFSGEKQVMSTANRVTGDQVL